MRIRTRGRQGLVTIVTALALATTLAACGSSDDEAGNDPAATTSAAAAARAYDGPEATLAKTYAEPTKKAGFTFTIGYPNPARSVPTLAAQEEGVREEVAKLGGKVIATDAQFDVQKQVSQFEQLLSQEVDAIVLSALDPNALAPLLKKAAAQDVPVYINDVPTEAGLPPVENVAGSILSGYDQMSFARAKAVADAQPGARFALVGLAIPAPMLQYQATRVKYWAEQLGLEYVDRVDAKVDSVESGAEAASGLLAKQSDLDAIFTVGDDLAVGTSTAARSSSRTDIKIVGSGANKTGVQAVKDGTLFATYFTDSKQLHRQLVWAAYNGLTDQHQPQPEQVVLDGGKIITKENADAIQPVG